jgi:hypothetical protein
MIKPDPGLMVAKVGFGRRYYCRGSQDDQETVPAQSRRALKTLLQGDNELDVASVAVSAPQLPGALHGVSSQLVADGTALRVRLCSSAQLDNGTGSVQPAGVEPDEPH